MTTNPRLRNSDARVWQTATWAAPFTIQVVLGLAVGISWLLGKYLSNVHGFGQFAFGAGATLLLSAAVSAALLTRESVRAQGVGISIVGSSVVAVVGATVYGFWIIGW
jgi:hypothetical protein